MTRGAVGPLPCKISLPSPFLARSSSRAKPGLDGASALPTHDALLDAATIPFSETIATVASLGISSAEIA